MDVFVTDDLLTLLGISATLSVFIMVLIQKVKPLPIFKVNWHVWLLNLFLSFALGIPFSLYFFKVDIISAIWVAIFSFIGAPAIYELLKEQNIINYTPKPMNNTVAIAKENEIKRT